MYSYGNCRTRIFIFEKEQAFSVQYRVYPIPVRVLFFRAFMLRIEVRGIVSEANYTEERICFFSSCVNCSKYSSLET